MPPTHVTSPTSRRGSDGCFRTCIARRCMHLLSFSLHLHGHRRHAGLRLQQSRSGQSTSLLIKRRSGGGRAGDEHDCLVFRRISIGFIAPLPFLCCCRNLNSAPAPFNANMKALAQEAVKKVYKRRGRRERGSARREGYELRLSMTNFKVVKEGTSSSIAAHSPRAVLMTSR